MAGFALQVRRGGALGEVVASAALVGVLGVTVVWGALVTSRAGAQGGGGTGSATAAGVGAGGFGGAESTVLTVSEAQGAGEVDAELAGYIASGTKLYGMTCIACHGPGGAGMPGLGKRLIQNEFVQSLDDDALLAFIQRGRDPSDPKNTTGVGMPAKGGNPALSEDDMLDIIAYLRTLQGGQAPTVLAGNK